MGFFKLLEFSKNKSQFLLEKGCLYIISTPIGNLGDITIRAIETLSKVDYILCEDTRITKKLLNKYNLKNKKLISYNDYNASEKRKYIIDNLYKKNFNYALVSDAGTPLISDPGYKLVKECINKNLSVTHLPGPSAVISGLILSGLSTDSFFFGGFFYKTPLKIEKQLSNIAYLNFTSVWFERGNRLFNTLNLIEKVLTNRQISVLRELTKMHEETFFGSAIDLKKQISKEKLRGEFIIVISGFKHEQADVLTLKKLILKDLKTFNTKELSSKLSDKTRLPKNFIYNEIIKLKNAK